MKNERNFKKLLSDKRYWWYLCKWDGIRVRDVLLHKRIKFQFLDVWMSVHKDGVLFLYITHKLQ